MTDVIRGRVWKFGHNINTDMIYPSRYLTIPWTEYKELAKHAMEGADPEFPKKVKKGDVIVGGENFGCGSGRDAAPISMKYSGISAVIANSFARIFYRNSINLGLPAFAVKGAHEKIHERDILEIDVRQGLVHDMMTGEKLSVPPPPKLIQDMLAEGGALQYYKKRLKSTQKGSPPKENNS